MNVSLGKIVFGGCPRTDGRMGVWGGGLMGETRMGELGIETAAGEREERRGNKHKEEGDLTVRKSMSLLSHYTVAVRRHDDAAPWRRTAATHLVTPSSRRKMSPPAER